MPFHMFLYSLYTNNSGSCKEVDALDRINYGKSITEHSVGQEIAIPRC
jgi:hypothetical protein